MTSCDKFIEQFRKLYQNITIDDLYNEWEKFQENPRHPSLPKFPELKKGQSFEYCISLFKEFDQKLLSKQIEYKDISYFFKQNILPIFEDPPDFKESEYVQLYQSCLTKIQSFYTLSLMPSSKLDDLKKLYNDSKELVCYYSQIYDEIEKENSKIESKLPNKSTEIPNDKTTKNLHQTIKIDELNNQSKNSQDEGNDSQTNKFNSSNEFKSQNAIQSKSYSSNNYTKSQIENPSFGNSNINQFNSSYSNEFKSQNAMQSKPYSTTNFTQKTKSQNEIPSFDNSNLNQFKSFNTNDKQSNLTKANTSITQLPKQTIASNSTVTTNTKSTSLPSKSAVTSTTKPTTMTSKSTTTPSTKSTTAASKSTANSSKNLSTKASSSNISKTCQSARPVTSNKTQTSRHLYESKPPQGKKSYKV